MTGPARRWRVIWRTYVVLTMVAATLLLLVFGIGAILHIPFRFALIPSAIAYGLYTILMAAREWIRGRNAGTQR